MVAKKHEAVASAVQTALGGSTYPVPHQWMEIPMPEGVIKRATKANTRRSSALITNSSEAFIFFSPIPLV